MWSYVQNVAWLQPGHNLTAEAHTLGVNFPGSLTQLLVNFWILKYDKIQIFMYTMMLATKNFQGVKTLKFPPANTFLF